MKMLKRVLEKKPLHYWTGATGGVVYIVWFAGAYYFQNFSHFDSQNFFSHFLALIILFPVFLFGAVDSIVSASNGYINFIFAFMLCDLLFVGIGIILGIRSSDLDRDRQKRMIVTAILIILAIGYIVFSAIGAFFSLLMPS